MGEVVAHVDCDCFYVQVEMRLNASLRGRPVAVMQYNPFERGGVSRISSEKNRLRRTNGSLIAVSYEARAFGVKRGMRGEQARRQLCPELLTVQVPTSPFGKADLQIYRDAGEEVARALRAGGPLERSSVDEVYVDVTSKARKALEDAGAGSHSWTQRLDANSPPLILPSDPRTALSSASESWWQRPRDCWSYSDRMLVAGAAIVQRLRDTVRVHCNFTCSAGVGRNKMLAKLASAMHKPNSQTLVPDNNVRELLDPLPVARIRGLGGKMGKLLEESLNVTTIGELSQVPMAPLIRLFGDRIALWMWQVARGIEKENVKERQLAKSLVTGKGFGRGNEIRSMREAVRWIEKLCADLHWRLGIDRKRQLSFFS
eukprot:jgi/Bigna1/44250/e_gw1.91.8.1